MRKHLLYILCGMLLLTGCDYLNRVPEKDIETVESLFEQRTKAESWWKGLYGEINTVLTSLTINTSFLGADEFADVTKSLRVVVVQDVHGYSEREYFFGEYR